MARLYTCGFELNQASFLGTVTEYNALSNSQVSTSATVKRSGGFALTANADDAFMTHLYQAEGTSNNHYLRFYLYIDTSISAGPSAIALFRSATSGNLCSLRLNTNNTLELWNEQTAAQLGSDSSALSNDTWYRIELEYRRSGSTAHAYINGTQFATGAIANTLTTSTIRLGIIDAATGLLYFDDVAVNDSTGSVQNTLPGDGSIVHAHPTGAGDNAATAGTFAEIDEVAPDDSATDRIQLDDTTTIADYAMTDSATLGIGSSDTISLVEVGVRIKEEASTTTSYNLRIKSASGGTTTSSGATDAGNTTYRTNPTGTTAFSHRLVSYLDPTTGVAWTPTGTNSIDNMQAGVRSNDADDIWVSTLWAVIEYVPGAGASVTPSTLALTMAMFAPAVTASDHKIVTPGTLVLTTTTFAPSISVSNNQLVTPGTAALTLATFAPAVALSNNQFVIPTTASLSLATFAPTVSATANQLITPGTLALVLTTFASIVTASDHKSVTPNTAALMLSSFAPTILISDNQSVTPSTTSLTISVFAPAVTTTANVTVTPDTLPLSLSTFAPSVVAGIRVTPDVVSLTMTSFAPTVSISNNQFVTPSTLALTLSTFAPAVSVSDHRIVTPTTATLTLSTFAPSLVLGTVVTPDTAGLTLTTFEPTVSMATNVTVIPDPASLTLATFAPTVTLGGNVTATPSTLSLVLATFVPNVHTGFSPGDDVGAATWVPGDSPESATHSAGDTVGTTAWVAGGAASVTVTPGGGIGSATWIPGDQV